MSSTTQPPIFGSDLEAERYLVGSLFNRQNANYYPAMARLVIDQALARRGPLLGGTVIDVGCGIGMSTMEILERTDTGRVFAVDSSDAMLRICETGFLGNSRVETIRASAGEPRFMNSYDAEMIFCIQMIHLLHKSEAESKVPAAVASFGEVLVSGGVLAMDFGPSNGDFRTFTLADPRMGPKDGEIMSELAHPLYRAVMDVLPEEASEWGLNISSFWPPASTRFRREFLEETLRARSFGGIRFVEGLYPMRGVDVWNHICLNLWTVAKRWLKDSGLTPEQFFKMLEDAVKHVMDSDDFGKHLTVSAFHPYQILTAVRE